MRYSVLERIRRSGFSVLIVLAMLFSAACSGTPPVTEIPNDEITEAGDMTDTEITTDAITTEAVTTEAVTTAAVTEEVINDPKAPFAYFSFDTLENGNFFEEKSGTLAKTVGTVTQADGKNGKSAYFNGGGHLAVDIDHPTRNNAHSIAAWIKVDTQRVTNESIIAGWGTYRKASDTRLLVFNGKLCVSSYGKLATCAMPEDISAQWHHVAITYSSNTYKMYLNGNLAASCSTDGIIMTDSDVYIGGFGIDRLNFYGWIDDMYLFDRAITEAEVRGCMNNAKNFSELDKNAYGAGVVSDVTFKEGSVTLTGKKYFTGYNYTCTYAVPQFKDVKEYALIVTFDGLNKQIAQVMANLYEEGVAPPAVIIGISGGTYFKTQTSGNDLGLRQLSYDVFNGEFADLIVEEIIPEMTRRFGLKISASPDMHMAAGGSSGGICAWNCVWFRNDYFHRVYMSSPTFSAMTNGYEAPVLMRLYETKDVRGFMDWSENEPNDYFGSSYLAGLNAKSALEYAGYDFEYRYNAGEGHCSRLRDEAGLTEAMRSVWKSYATPVRAKRDSAYITKLTPHSAVFAEVQEKMPTPLRAYAAGGVFSAEGGDIFFTSDKGEKRKVGSGFSDISALAVSSDAWLLYIAEKDGNVLYSMAIGENGTLKEKIRLAVLYTDTYGNSSGVSAMCVDSEDRIYAVTDMGIQVVKSYGIVCAIIDSPFGEKADKIAFGGANMKYLYVEKDGVVFRRAWNVAGRADEKTVTKAVSRDYYS